jgi:hypothetical protein
MDIVRSTPTSQYDINVGITYLFNDRPPWFSLVFSAPQISWTPDKWTCCSIGDELFLDNQEARFIGKTCHYLWMTPIMMINKFQLKRFQHKLSLMKLCEFPETFLNTQNNTSIF